MPCQKGKNGIVRKLQFLNNFLLLLFFSVFAQALTAQPAPGAPGSAPVLPPVPAEAPLFSDTGDAAIARRYLEWAEREYAAGRTAQALLALERGADYGAASSDILFFLAVLRSMEGRSRLSVLDVVSRALETGRWERFTAEDARLLAAKTLTELRRFEEALTVLERCDPESYNVQYCRLPALRGLAQKYGEEAGFAGALTVVMDRFPRETAPVRLLFDYALSLESGETLRPLIDLAIRRLPALLEADPELAYMASSFMWNREESRTLVASYRAAGNPNPASLPAALRLGLIDGKMAVEELFASRRDTLQNKELPGQAVLDKELIIAVNGLLGTEDERNYLRRNLLQYSGVIMEDRDNDGIVEAWTMYREGMIREYRYDADQDGEADLTVSFAQGLPAQAEIAMEEVYSAEMRAPENPGRKKALLRWERYPAVLDAEVDGKRYIPRPLDYYYTPFRFVPLVMGGPDYPERETTLPIITERNLLSFAVIMEQPSADFPGGIERIELSGGIPVKSTVFTGGKKVSETEFVLGKPVIQYLDLDMDGRMETIRRYDPNVPYRVLSTESDWDGDGINEYKESLEADGSIKKSWDFNRDGIRE